MQIYSIQKSNFDLIVEYQSIDLNFGNRYATVFSFGIGRSGSFLGLAKLHPGLAYSDEWVATKYSKSLSPGNASSFISSLLSLKAYKVTSTFKSPTASKRLTEKEHRKFNDFSAEKMNELLFD